jgi:NAD(P)-dependent dehydrogenase (short-subunit alcohol dehydrogenase family)
MTTSETRETTQRPAGQQLKGRVALVTGGARVVGTAISRPLASRLGRRDGVACVVDFLCAHACSLITALVWAVDGSQEI